jgi:Outer membrane protein beta-barrel domain
MTLKSIPGRGQWLAQILLCLCAVAAGASAQESGRPTPHYEIGGHLYSIGGVTNDGAGTTSGFGGRFTYNFNEYLAVDSELDAGVYLDDQGSGFTGMKGFAGLKAGKRVKRIGVFAKARPGFVTDYTKATPFTPPPGSFQTFTYERTVKPAFDVGGVFEAYFKEGKAALRLDAGDVIIPFGNDLVDPVVCPCPRRLGTTHNLGLGLGFSIRFWFSPKQSMMPKSFPEVVDIQSGENCDEVEKPKQNYAAGQEIPAKFKPKGAQMRPEYLA